MSRSATVSDTLDASSIITATSTTNSAGTIRQDKNKLFVVEQNPFSPESVVLLHVLFSCGLEWKYVCPKLSSYHLLVPDLPCHSASRDVCRREDFSFEMCADYVADLIRERAHDGRAHLVGVSMGGFVALELARKYPQVPLPLASITGPVPMGFCQGTAM